VRRVPGDGVLGLGRYSVDATSSGLVPGLLVVVAVIVLAIAVHTSAGRSAVLVPAFALALSLLTFFVPAGLSNVTGALPPVTSGRYSVAPVLLFYVALALLTHRVLVRDPLPLGRTSLQRGGPGALLPRVIGVGLVGVLAFGLVSSWSEPQRLRRGPPSWSSEITRARAACAADAAREQVRVRISPVGWRVIVPCSRVSARR
jgi:hypothetical protein